MSQMFCELTEWRKITMRMKNVIKLSWDVLCHRANGHDFLYNSTQW